MKVKTRRLILDTCLVWAVVPLAAAAFGSQHSKSFSSVSSSVRISDDHLENPSDFHELPVDFPRRNEVLLALDAVRKACRVTQALQPETEQASTTKDAIGMVQKQDLSPVTVADYAVQAVVLHHLQQAAGDSVGYIAEEDSSSLLADDDLCRQVMQASDMQDRQALLDAIDLGKSYTKWNDTGSTPSRETHIDRPGHVWCLDPIDGTRGFLRGKKSGGQYCVALALVDEGRPTIGILGCPNLPAGVDDGDFGWKEGETPFNNHETRGCVFVASRGGGCYQLPLEPNGKAGVRLAATPNDGSVRPLRQARFCIGVEKYSDALGQWCVCI